MTSPNTRRLRVQIQHQAPLVALGMRVALSQQFDMELLPGRLASADAPPQLIVADHAQGMALATERRQATGVLPRLMIVSTACRGLEVQAALEAGVEGYVSLRCPPEELVFGLRQLASGVRHYCAESTMQMADALFNSPLTPREREVLALVARGLSNRSMAEQLGLSAETVKRHMTTILDKLHASSRTQALSLALQRGLIPSAAAAQAERAYL